jgi:hypothetical protein
VFSHNKEKIMLIDRSPPSPHQLIEQLAAQIARTGRRAETATIPATRPATHARHYTHRIAPKRTPAPAPRDTGAYTPELSAMLDSDRRLCDGAKLCARKLAAYGYLRHRDDRACRITVSYLAKSLNRCRRTVQRYLRQLEEAGYIDTLVLQSGIRMCTGLAVRLLSSLFPKHHASKWPSRLTNSGATVSSHKQRYLFIPAKITPVPLADWADKCHEGVWRSLMSRLTPIPAIA